MALDTRDKRASALGVGFPARVVYPNPDGLSLDQGDRQQAAYAYRGILAGSPAVAIPDYGFLAVEQGPRLLVVGGRPRSLIIRQPPQNDRGLTIQNNDRSRS